MTIFGDSGSLLLWRHHIKILSTTPNFLIFFFYKITGNEFGPGINNVLSKFFYRFFFFVKVLKKKKPRGLK